MFITSSIEYLRNFGMHQKVRSIKPYMLLFYDRFLKHFLFPVFGKNVTKSSKVYKKVVTHTLRVNLHVNVKSTRLHHKPFIYFLFWFWKIENYTPFCHGSMSFSITLLQWSGFRHCQKFMSSWLSFLDIFLGVEKNLLYIGTWLCLNGAISFWGMFQLRHLL